MVRFVYNVVQNILILLLWPLVLLFVAIKEKYRKRFWSRCGFGLRKECQRHLGSEPRIWIHALSVGELSSVVSLLKALRKTYPDGTIFLSTSTTSGVLYAKERLTDHVDGFIAFPYDHFLIVRYFLSVVRPSMFIQVETDFWPNVLAEMVRFKVVSFLVNGRVSLRSFSQYQKYPQLFVPLFNSFTCLGMQTATDVTRMQQLGIDSGKICLPGNLKIDAAMPQDHDIKIANLFPSKRVVVFGSTHPGEEEELAPLLVLMKQEYPDVCFVIAPRDIKRGREVVQILDRQSLQSYCRSLIDDIPDDIDCLVLDTMGELVSIYKQAELVFVGGSLQPFGGHNPLEPVAFGVPVLFGTHMEDFEDICAEMLDEHCAIQVTDSEMLGREMCSLLKDQDRCKELGQAGLDYIIKRQGVTERHLDIIERLLAGAR